MRGVKAAQTSEEGQRDATGAAGDPIRMRTHGTAGPRGGSAVKIEVLGYRLLAQEDADYTAALRPAT